MRLSHGTQALSNSNYQTLMLKHQILGHHTSFFCLSWFPQTTDQTSIQLSDTDSKWRERVGGGQQCLLGHLHTITPANFAIFSVNCNCDSMILTKARLGLELLARAAYWYNLPRIFFALTYWLSFYTF